MPLTHRQIALANTSRAACAAHAGNDDIHQLNVTGNTMAISCTPAEASGYAAPCIYEFFYHFPPGFEDMDQATLARFWADKQHIEAFNQCKSRKTDADWPTAELFEKRTHEVRTIADVMDLLGPRVVTFVGASVARATVGAIQCALASHGLRTAPRNHELQWRQWGWAAFSSDNHQCSKAHWDNIRRGNASAPDAVNSKWFYRAARVANESCVTRGRGFQKMLDSSDVVVVGYNPQHYEGLLDWWELDLRMMLPLLSRWAKRPGKVAILREPPAQHFAGGAFNPHHKTWVSKGLGCCPEITEEAAYSNFNWRAVEKMHAVAKDFPNVHVIPWYNATLKRYGAHIGTRAACFSQSTTDTPEGPRVAWARKKECGCDCTHYCYTPLFYDATILTPLHHILKRELKVDARLAPAEAGGRRLSDRLRQLRGKRRTHRRARRDFARRPSDAMPPKRPKKRAKRDHG